MLELVATMPSRPLAGVVVALDIGFSLSEIVAEPRGECGNATFPYTPKTFQLPCGVGLVRPNLERCLAQNLLLQALVERQGAEFVKILLNIGHARSRPIRAE